MLVQLGILHRGTLHRPLRSRKRQNYSRPITETSDAIIALDIDTGKARWAFQARNDDAWNASCEVPEGLDFNCSKPMGHDFDFGAPPVLVEQPGGGDVVLAADKGGSVYSIDPDSGKLKWSKRLGKGSALGGVHWGLAVDQSRVYVAVADAFVDKTSVLSGNLLDLLGGDISIPVEPVAGGNPGLYALDIQTGAQIWYVQPIHTHEGKPYLSIYSAALTVTNDVLFAGALDGELAAFSTADGKELWRVDTDIPFVDVNGVDGEGGTIDSVGAVPVADTLLLNTGYNNFGGVDAYQAGPGNGLFIFQLKK
jgi:polyvinyl alcohol dehydrogenase (cytochrome)